MKTAAAWRQECNPRHLTGWTEEQGHERCTSTGRHAPDDPLPEGVATGAEPYLIVGAMAGG
jgi:hypothetical protein